MKLIVHNPSCQEAEDKVSLTKEACIPSRHAYQDSVWEAKWAGPCASACMSLISITQLDIELRRTQFRSRSSSDESVSRRQLTSICGLTGINKISTRCSWQRINIRGFDHCADSRGPCYHAQISWRSKQHHARSLVERWDG